MAFLPFFVQLYYFTRLDRLGSLGQFAKLGWVRHIGEFELHVDYIERLHSETKEQVDELKKWRIEIENRVGGIEKRESRRVDTTRAKQPSNVRKEVNQPPDSMDLTPINEPPIDARSQRVSDHTPAPSIFRPGSTSATVKDSLPRQGNRKADGGNTKQNAQAKGTNGPKKGKGKNRTTAKPDDTNDNPYALLAEPISVNDRATRSVNTVKVGKKAGNATKSSTPVPDKPTTSGGASAEAVNSSWYDEDEEEIEMPQPQRNKVDNVRKSRKCADGNDDQPPPKRTQFSKPNDQFFDAVDDPSSLDSPPVSVDSSSPSDDDDMNDNPDSELASSSPDRVINNESSSDSYAERAKKGKWIDPNRKRKRNRENKSNKFTLKAAEDIEVKDIYVSKLDYTNCNQPSDLENMVDRYCRARGIKTLELCTIPYGNSRRKANCKVTVAATDYKKARMSSFWPSGSIVRDWLTKEEYQKNEKAGNDNSN